MISGIGIALAFTLATAAPAEAPYVRAGRLIDTEHGTGLTDRLIRAARSKMSIM